MPPNSKIDPEVERTATGVLNEEDVETVDGGLQRDVKTLYQASDRRVQYIWPNFVVFGVAHTLAVYGLWQIFVSAKIYTALFTFVLYNMSILGITAGVHRLWAHRAYKATFPLRLLLVFFSTIAHQNSVIHWAREHRVHHKFSETDADPVNASRGFFFSHIGWLLVKKHPDVTAKGKQVDISDLEADWLLAFQRKHYVYCTLVVSIFLPLVIPVVYWNETWLNALCIAVMLRWTCSLNATWLVNSAAHMYGHRPYDVNINPSENASVALVTLGEGFHNYHHVFPWDYKTSEFGNPLNPTKVFIDACARIGWAYDMKTVSQEIIDKRTERTGDGSKNLWGWGDADQSEEERRSVKVTNRKKQQQ